MCGFHFFPAFFCGGVFLFFVCLFSFVLFRIISGFFLEVFFNLLVIFSFMARFFKNLRIYHMSYSFLLEIYDMLPLLPDFESKNMFSQLQRAATSIVLNIVEGSSHRSVKVFINHLQYSYGSSKEVEVLLLLAKDLHYIDEELFFRLSGLLDELSASIFSFMASLDDSFLVNRSFSNSIK